MSHMKKDIPQHKVEDIALAIAPRDSEDDEFWDVYLVNLKNEMISNVLISSNGYGEISGEKMKTTTLRHFFEEIAPLSCTQIEPIQTRLFALNNEYMISFVLDDYMYDKTYIFVSGSIDSSHFTPVPFLGRKGVMIR
jgi:hypothetical protein